MSHLSDRCQQFLTESGTSVYQLSKTSGLDRASLHRLVTGKRIPTLEFLTKFCQAMRLNHADIQELFELYEESHAGSANFQNRKLICQIFSDLDGLSSASFQESPKTLSPDLLPPVFTSTRPIPSMAGNSRQTLGLVQQFLLRLFHEKPDGTEVLTNAPLARMGLLPFFYALQSLYHKHLRLHHLLYFSANPSLGADSNPNLEILRFVLPIALSDFNFYEPRFTYINLGKNDMEAMLWPYYIICEDLLLVLRPRHASCRTLLHQTVPYRNGTAAFSFPPPAPPFLLCLGIHCLLPGNAQKRHSGPQCLGVSALRQLLCAFLPVCKASSFHHPGRWKSSFDPGIFPVVLGSL